MPLRSFQTFGANSMIVVIVTIANSPIINCLAISFKVFTANRMIFIILMNAINPVFSCLVVSYLVASCLVISNPVVNSLLVDYMAILSTTVNILGAPVGRRCLLGMGPALPHEGHQQRGTAGLAQEGVLQQEGCGCTLGGFAHQCRLQEADEAGRGPRCVAQLGWRH